VPSSRWLLSQSMMQAIRSTRPGGHVGYVGVAHGVELPGEELFFSHVQLHGDPAPVRRFLPELIDLIWNRQIDLGKVFDSNCPSNKPPTDTRRWTNGEPSRPCSEHEPKQRRHGKQARERNGHRKFRIHNVPSCRGSDTGRFPRKRPQLPLTRMRRVPSGATSVSSRGPAVAPSGRRR
jgi:hypothetical protein